MTEVLILLVAFFMGPTSDFGPGFMFYDPTFSDKESCNQYVLKNQDWLHVYLSGKWNTLPDVYGSKLYCWTNDELKEFKKYFSPKSGKQIAI